MSSPIIGVTPSAGDNKLGVRTHNLAVDYTQAIERAGGVPVILPLHVQDTDALIGMLDGIVFSGGGDIEASLFNQEPHETVSGIDDERDSFEMKMMESAFARDMPILAICRGVQVMNVQQGGDLIQDIPSQTDSKKEHGQRNVKAGEHDTFDEVEIENGQNPIARAMGPGTVKINSFHHQALGNVAPTLEVVAKSDDGIIEAVYAPKQTYTVGTQWHPERLASADAKNQSLFNDLIAAAKKFAGKK